MAESQTSMASPQDSTSEQADMTSSFDPRWNSTYTLSLLRASDTEAVIQHYKEDARYWRRECRHMTSLVDPLVSQLEELAAKVAIMETKIAKVSSAKDAKARSAPKLYSPDTPKAMINEALTPQQPVSLF